jgi:PPM family protein phosphatase
MTMLRAADTTKKTDPGLQRRDNEDSMFAQAPVFVVADGMGGAQAGEVASRIAIETFEEGLPESGSPEERLVKAVQAANQRIHELASTERERAGMGTTLTAAYLDDSDLAIAHVGDSRAYLFRDGELTRLTQDHSLVEELVRQGKLTPEQAAEHPQRSIITRALGPEPTVNVDTWTYPVRAGDVLLLCSDGLTSMISEADVAEVLSSTSDLDQAAQRLIDAANEAGGRDNITVVLFRLEDVGVDGITANERTMIVSPAARAATEAPRDTATADAATAETATADAAPPDGADADAEGAREPGRASSASAVAPPPGLSQTRAIPAPVAGTHGRPGEPPPRKERRYIKPLAALLAVVIVLGLVIGGGYLASRQLYFIGTNSQGIVTIYRGFPYDLPGGIHLYETFYESGVPASLVPPDRRGALFNHHLRSETDAANLVHDLELGRISR